MKVARMIGVMSATIIGLGLTVVPAVGQTPPEIQNARIEKAQLVGDMLTVDLVIELRAATKLNNMVLIQEATAGSKYWASTHDWGAATSAASLTLRGTVSIPKFSRPKQSNVTLGVLVGGGGGIVYDPGQTGELDLKKGSRSAFKGVLPRGAELGGRDVWSNRLEVTFQAFGEK